MRLVCALHYEDMHLKQSRLMEVRAFENLSALQRMAKNTQFQRSALKYLIKTAQQPKAKKARGRLKKLLQKKDNACKKVSCLQAI